MTDHEYHEALDASAPAETERTLPVPSASCRAWVSAGTICTFTAVGDRGRCPSCACSTAVGADSRSRNSDLALRSSPARCRRSYPKWSVRGSLSVRATPRTAVSFRAPHAGGSGARPARARQAGGFRRAAFSALTVEEQEQLAEMLEKIRVTWEELDG